MEAASTTRRSACKAGDSADGAGWAAGGGGDTATAPGGHCYCASWGSSRRSCLRPWLRSCLPWLRQASAEVCQDTHNSFSTPGRSEDCGKTLSSAQPTRAPTNSSRALWARVFRRSAAE
jgi:hypothetical protein